MIRYFLLPLLACVSLVLACTNTREAEHTQEDTLQQPVDTNWIAPESLDSVILDSARIERDSVSGGLL